MVKKLAVFRKEPAKNWQFYGWLFDLIFKNT
jgi:hypothetical protein